MKTNGKARVSVVIAVFNAERYLTETIESVFSQTFGDWELILVDDGSTDSSATIAKGYAAKHPDLVRYLEHTGRRRRGQCASRNLAIRNALGEFIATLDHDDVWMPKKLERQVAILDAHPEAAMVYGATHYWHTWAGDRKGQQRDYLQMAGVPANTIYTPPELLTLHLSEKIVPPLPTDFMLRKKAIEDLGGFEESFLGAMSTFEDQAFLVKVYASYPVFVSDETWAKYRIHPDQHCAKIWQSEKLHSSELFYLSWVLEFLESQGILSHDYDATIRRRLWPHRHPLLGRLYWKYNRFASRIAWAFRHREDQRDLPPQ